MKREKNISSLILEVESDSWGGGGGGGGVGGGGCGNQILEKESPTSF